MSSTAPLKITPQIPHFRAAPPRLDRLTFVAALVAGLLSGCGGGEIGSASVRETRYPLTSYRSETPDRVSIHGDPFPTWVSWGGARLPAISGNGSFAVAVQWEELHGKEIRGKFGFPDGAMVSEPPAAIFRVRITPELDAEGAVLLEEAVTATEPRALRSFVVGVPETADGYGYLSLEVEFLTPAVDGAVATWLDPVVVGRRAPTAKPPREPWNVLLITSDTTRQDYLGCYGGPARTPTLESLASDGVRFTRAFSVAYGTTPSHASLLTGSHAAQHGIYDNDTILGSEIDFLPAILSTRGYATAGFVSAKPLIRALGFSRGFDLFDDFLVLDPESGLGPYSEHERRADVTVSRFLRWFEQLESEPFFSWIHLFDPHQPYAPPAADPTTELGREQLATEVGTYFETEEGTPLFVNGRKIARRQPHHLEEVDRLARDRYRREIEFVDRQVGRVIEALKRRELYDRTLIVFVTDHGEEFLNRGAERAFRHTSLFTEVSRLALIVKLPEFRGGGEVHDFLLGNLDVAPTILDVLALEQPADWAGKSFLPLIDGRAARGRGFRPHLVLEGAHQKEISVRTRRWMYRRLLPGYQPGDPRLSYLDYQPGAPSEVYDLDADPAEAGGMELSACPDLEQLRSIVADFLDWKELGSQGQALGDPEHLRALKALGYTD